MEIFGNLRKMRSVLSNTVEYSLPIGDREVKMNDLLGKEVKLEYLGEIHCIKCGRKTNKSFSQGYCYPCFVTVPETEECVFRPELCLAQEGKARDMDYAKEPVVSGTLVGIKGQYLIFDDNTVLNIRKFGG